MCVKIDSYLFQAGLLGLLIITSPFARGQAAPATTAAAAAPPQAVTGGPYVPSTPTTLAPPPSDPSKFRSEAELVAIQSIFLDKNSIPAPAQPPAKADGTFWGTTTPGTDPVATPGVVINGDIRHSDYTGHTNNYNERIADNITNLPELLVLANGQPVKDADTWVKQRRPEILKLFETEIFGKVPANAPKVTWEVASSDNNGTMKTKRIVGHVGDASNPKAFDINLTVNTPANATGPVPLILQVGQPPGADWIASGYGTAGFNNGQIEADSAAPRRTGGVIEYLLPEGKVQPAPDEWGSIAAWAWGLSRCLDYLETDKDVDAKRVAIVGHSRLAKTVLWAGAEDQRFAMVLSSQSGEMGAALSRHDYGESVDEMGTRYNWQFAGNLGNKYVGHWKDDPKKGGMPTDGHMLIALIAPRPVFITAGNGDPWSDPHGEFLGAVYAGPAYKLLGEPDLGLDKNHFPAIDTPVINGKIAYLHHTGPHAILQEDWDAFYTFAEKYLKAPSSAAKPATTTAAKP